MILYISNNICIVLKLVLVQFLCLSHCKELDHAVVTLKSNNNSLPDLRFEMTYVVD